MSVYLFNDGFKGAFITGDSVLKVCDAGQQGGAFNIARYVGGAFEVFNAHFGFSLDADRRPVKLLQVGTGQPVVVVVGIVELSE